MPPSYRCRHVLLCIFLPNWVPLILCEPALRGSIRQELDQEQQLQPEWKKGNASSALSKTPQPDTTTPDGNTTSRELQQTSVQTYTSTYQSGTGIRLNDTAGPVGVSGIGQQPQITTNPENAGSNIVFGGAAQPGAPGIAGGGTIPTLGGPSGLGLSGVGFRRALEDMDGVEDIQALEQVGSTMNLQPDSSMEATANATERELQQTSVQAFINSYSSGGRFNDTGPTGITGAIPGGHTHLPQVSHSPVEPGGAGGVVFGGGAGAGAPGIAGGTMPLLAGQPGVGSGGAGIGASPTGLGTTAGTIGGAPGGAGFIGPSGLPAPIAAPGGVGSTGGIGGI